MEQPHQNPWTAMDEAEVEEVSLPHERIQDQYVRASLPYKRTEVGHATTVMLFGLETLKLIRKGREDRPLYKNRAGEFEVISAEEAERYFAKQHGTSDASPAGAESPEVTP